MTDQLSINELQPDVHTTAISTSPDIYEFPSLGTTTIRNTAGNMLNVADMYSGASNLDSGVPPVTEEKANSALFDSSQRISSPDTGTKIPWRP